MSLPLLSLTGARYGNAAPPGFGPKRLVVVVHRQGTLLENWWPTGTEQNFQLSPILQPLAPYQDQLLVVGGVDNMVNELNFAADGHIGPERSLFTCEVFSENMSPSGELSPPPEPVNLGQAGAASFDQIVAQRIGGADAFRSIDLTVGTDGDAPDIWTSFNDGFFWSGRAEGVTSIADPRLTFQYLFEDPGLTDPDAFNALRDRRLSVLDAVQGQFREMRTAVGNEDRMILDAHADKVRSVEQRLRNLNACTTPDPQYPGAYDFRFDDPDSVRLQVDMMITAFACGLTSVGTLGFTNGHDHQFPFIPEPNPVVPPVPDGYEDDPDVNMPEFGYTNWHDMVHRGQSDPAAPEPGLLAAFTWYQEQVAYLLEQLASTPDPDGGSMLDHTMVLITSEFGNGGLHWTQDIPVVLAGNAGANVDMGRWLDLRAPGEDARNTHSTNQLFASLLQAFGGTDESFGRTGTYTVTWDGSAYDVTVPGGTLPL